jgi:hypothetical protein
MSKVVTWGPPQLVDPNSPYAKRSGFSSLAEKFQAAQAEREEIEGAQLYLQKSRPAMLALLEIKMRNQEPLYVMRPLGYEGTGFQHERDPRDQNIILKSKPVVERKVLMPGTRLIFKSIDPNLHLFIFTDPRGEEVEIPFNDRDLLLTKTDIYEQVKNFMESIKE